MKNDRDPRDKWLLVLLGIGGLVAVAGGLACTPLGFVLGLFG